MLNYITKSLICQYKKQTVSNYISKENTHPVIADTLSCIFDFFKTNDFRETPPTFLSHRFSPLFLSVFLYFSQKYDKITEKMAQKGDFCEKTCTQLL